MENQDLKSYLKKEINKINNHRLPNQNRTDKLINLFFSVFQEKTHSFDRYKYVNGIDNVTQNNYYNKKKCISYSFYELYHIFINEFNLNKMTNQEKIKEANRLIKEVIVSEYDNKNLNDSSLKYLEKLVSEKIVNHWYLLTCEDIFVSANEAKQELDIYLDKQRIVEKNNL